MSNPVDPHSTVTDGASSILVKDPDMVTVATNCSSGLKLPELQMTNSGNLLVIEDESDKNKDPTDELKLMIEKKEKELLASLQEENFFLAHNIKKELNSLKARLNTAKDIVLYEETVVVNESVSTPNISIQSPQSPQNHLGEPSSSTETTEPIGDSHSSARATETLILRKDLPVSTKRRGVKDEYFFNESLNPLDKGVRKIFNERNHVVQWAYNLTADTHTSVAVVFKDPVTKKVYVGGAGSCLNYISIPEDMETKWVPPLHPQSYLLSLDVCKQLPFNSPNKQEKKSTDPKSRKPVWRFDPNFAQKCSRTTSAPGPMDNTSVDPPSPHPPLVESSSSSIRPNQSLDETSDSTVIASGPVIDPCQSNIDEHDDVSNMMMTPTNPKKKSSSSAPVTKAKKPRKQTKSSVPQSNQRVNRARFQTPFGSKQNEDNANQNED